MNWQNATYKELCAVILFDLMATDEDKTAASNELFSRIGGNRREEMQCKGMQC